MVQGTTISKYPWDIGRLNIAAYWLETAHVPLINLPLKTISN